MSRFTLGFARLLPVLRTTHVLRSASFMSRSVLTVVCVLLLPRAIPAAERVDFNRQIRPILSDKCFACHGPDEQRREGGVRLDVKESALGEADSGERPIVPGEVESSELYRRITSQDEFERMPPPDSHKSLTPEEIERIRLWIEQGAPWSEHWSLVAPKKPAVPPVSDPAWCRNPVDNFILARLDAESLKPALEADQETLIRRVSLDLTGLPPKPEEVTSFLADTAPDAYERIVDRLLESPHYGEHLARYWLDAVRYGDTHGLHLDNYREMWPYRDWVVRAFNENLPYDQFLTWQLAGDLLPEPTLDQLTATGFLRCNVSTNEGGSIVEEVYVRNVVDVVVTTASVTMGLTFDCTRCHDHKYDPLTMRDFYSMFAFFNSIDGSPMDGNATQHPPVIKVPTAEQEAAEERLETRIATLKRQLAAAVKAAAYDETADASESEQPDWTDFVWMEDDVPAGASSASEGSADGKWTFVSAPQPVYSGQTASTRTAQGRSQHLFEKASPGLRIGQNDKVFAYVYLDPDNPPKEIMLQWNTGQWKHRAYWGENLIDWGTDGSTERRPMGKLPEPGQWTRLEVDAAHVGIKPGAVITGWAFTQFDGTVYWDKAGAVTATPQTDAPFSSLAAWVRAQRAAGAAGLPHPIDEIVKLDRDRRNAAQREQLRDYFVENAYAGAHAALDPFKKELADAERELAELDKQVPTSYVFRELRDPKPAFVLKRGEYDKPAEQVTRAIPAYFGTLPADAPQNRLGVVQWLLDPAHPLTARVAVNRFWQQPFGVGLVKTSEDFGSQGEPPSHPELLDWLAIEFRDSGWNVKQLMKRIVMSATYRQTAKAPAELYARDPQNRLLARGPRFRLDAEMLRDQALAVSGLLQPQIGGPGVKPPQPELWSAVGYVTSNTAKFVADTGPEKVHRRTVYTFIKRTSPPPQMSTFDAPSRESFCVRRERTNTPLQALLLLNDPQYFEAARGLAERAMKEGGESPGSRAQYLYRRCTCRAADEAALGDLVELYEAHLSGYVADEEAARQTIGVGESKPDASLDVAQLAAWTMVANLVLNLDEVICK